MRLLIATGLYAPEIGGPAIHTALLEKGLPQHGIEVHVVPFSFVRALPLGIRHAAYAARLIFATFRSDVILAQDAFSVGFPAIVASKLTGTPCIVRIPGDHAWEQGRQRYGVVDDLDTFQTKKYSKSVERIRKIQRWVVAHAQEVVVPSLYMKGVVEKWGVGPEKIVVIYNGVDLHERPIDVPAKADGVRIVTSARLVAWKGIEGVIDAVARIGEAHLFILGDGPLRDEFEERVIERGIQSRVTFVGRVKHSEALGWYKSADAFVLNSSYEGMSHLLLEVMVQGTPIIATRVGGNVELLDRGAGLLIAPGDTEALVKGITTIMRDKDFARSLSEAARARVEQYSSSRSVEAFATLIEGIAS